MHHPLAAAAQPTAHLVASFSAQDRARKCIAEQHGSYVRFKVVLPIGGLDWQVGTLVVPVFVKRLFVITAVGVGYIIAAGYSAKRILEFG